MPDFITLAPQGRRQTLEYAWVGVADAHAPVCVFLHEGLGCVALWRQFPARLCARLGLRGLVYSRFAYGASTPRPHDEPFPRDYLHREAVDVLPALLTALDIRQPWLLGHSDGGSIALIAAARNAPALSGIITLAPHYFVEDACLTGIRRARDAYERGTLRQKLAKYHHDVDSAFYGWCNAWLDPARHDWSIEAELPNIACPTLAMQGVEDEYAASLAQIEGIQRQSPHTALHPLPGCDHNPHLRQPELVIEAIAAFMGETAPIAGGLSTASD
ncbi:MAG: alpha/beta hydrolase [Zoogloeaceae bacterium]|jgi:pimeloyl-ACP methyl ester carboxylesterase|nr:alpha/beta hydrolase [Zoogloeaceae bacterium]